MGPNPPARLSPRVTIVIVNWNKRHYVMKLLDSLQQIDYDNFEIVIVDNASTDDSVPAIKQHPLAVTLLENSENLGGTGGFNTGLRYSIDMLQDYIWLLDNDAEVLPETLRELVRVMEKDSSIGVAGSCIMSPEDHDLIVEAGAFVGCYNGTSQPHLRYKNAAEYLGARIIDVDSVAACSALVRDAVVQKVGLMDERYFLHWDDIDYCVRIRLAGYRVVAVMDAPAYHVAEKGYHPATSYYNFRNMLLFQAKFSQKSTFRSMHAIATNYLTLAYYLRLLGHKDASFYLSAALTDFLELRFGKTSVSSSALTSPNVLDAKSFRQKSADCKSVLIFGVGSFEDVTGAIAALKALRPEISISLAVAADRAPLYRLSEVDLIITFDIFGGGVLAKLGTAWRVLTGGFDCGITAGTPLMLPYAFLLRQNFYYAAADGAFREAACSRASFWKVPVAMALGRAAALIFKLPLRRAVKNLRVPLAVDTGSESLAK